MDEEYASETSLESKVLLAPVMDAKAAVFPAKMRPHKTDADAEELDADKTDPDGGIVVRLLGMRTIEVEVSLSTESQFFAGLSGDIASGGLFVQTYELCPAGSRVTLDITLPDARILGTGIVCWIRPAGKGAPPGMGIVLEHLSTADRDAIEAFCAVRPPLYHELLAG